MHTKTAWFSVVVLIITGGLVWLWFYSGQHNQSPKQVKEVTFVCSEGKSIQAAFSKDNVRLKLSDGRDFSLDQAISASGARYANGEGGIVFWNKGNTAFITENDSTTYRHCVVKGEDDLTNLEMFRDEEGYFVLRYPHVLKRYRSSAADTSGWSYASTEKGDLAVQLKLDSSFQPNTNFAEATMSVGWSQHPKALKECLESLPGMRIKADTVMFNTTRFVRSRYADAGAGNFYQVVQYRTLKENRCYSIEEMVHSMNIHNYPPERGITEFDSTRVWKILNTAVSTFSFTD
ncbi:MAG TPA: MliC family protein [Balneolaceae bacterium]|nr:MliC family protein [Balneolaceae bacterium]